MFAILITTCFYLYTKLKKTRWS